MKKFLTIVALALICTTANSQGFKDKLKNKLSGGGGEDALADKEWVSIGEAAKTWADGEYSLRSENGGMWEPKGKKELKFVKDGAGEVEYIEHWGEKYEASSSSGVNYVISYQNGRQKLYVTETTIIEYYIHSNSGAVIIENCIGEKLGVGKAKKEVEAYRLQAKDISENQQAGYEADQQAVRDSLMAIRVDNYSIKGKDVTKIEIINLEIPEQFGHYRGFTFEVQATLKDGSKISTKGSDEGFMSDYSVTYDKDTYDYGKLEKGFLSDDKIKITVESNYHSGLTTTEDAVLKYNEDITNKWNGTSWSHSAGESAMNFKMEVKQTKHAITGADLLMVRVTNVTDGGTLVDEYKISVDQTVHFFCKGGKGGDGDTQGGVDGARGGNGGVLTVIKDPNVKYFNLDYSVAGGRGGKGKYSTGSDGRDGEYREEVRAVKF